MATQASRRVFQFRLWVLFMFFFIPGLLMTSRAARAPVIRDQLTLSTAEIGAVLLGLSVGSMSGILCSAQLVEHFGTHKVIRIAVFFTILGMLVFNLTPWVSSASLLVFGLAIFGASLGSAEAAISVEDAVIEREMNKTVLPVMYGFYSPGTLFGARVGMAVTGFGLSAAPHILAAAPVATLPIAIVIRAIPDDIGENAAEVVHGEVEGLPVWRGAQSLLIGVIVLAMAFAEGSASDWLPLLVVDGHDFSSISDSLVRTGSTLGMTLGRFTDDWSIDRYSRMTVVRGSTVMGVLSIGLIILIDSPWVAGISVPLRGIGASLGFPLTISAISDTRSDASERVSVVAITGYLAFLIRPLLLSFPGERFGLCSTVTVVLGLVMVAVLVARAMAKLQFEPVMENSQ